MRPSFGQFGGRYIPETLSRALDELTGSMPRPSPTRPSRPSSTTCTRLCRQAVAAVLRPPADGALRRARIYLKRKDLNHTGAHKINNTLGQALMTLRDGQAAGDRRDGAGQHSVATATACADFGLNAWSDMGERGHAAAAKRLQHEAPRPSPPGDRRFANLARRGERGLPRLDEQRRIDALLPVGSVVGRIPSGIVRDFQSIIGREQRAKSSSSPPAQYNCGLRGGSNAAGMFYPFIADAEVELVGVEAGAVRTARRPRRHALVRPARHPARGLQLRATGRRRPDFQTCTA